MGYQQEEAIVPLGKQQVMLVGPDSTLLADVPGLPYPAIFSDDRSSLKNPK
jgi:hypothetical protein